MKNNQKTIAVINKKETHRPDAGHWLFDNKTNKWVENYNLIEEMKSFYTLRRDGNSSFVFHVDSFPRQGNTTLRSILLQSFPELVMPDPMAHVTSSTDKAIKNGQIVLAAIRDPHDTLSSFISRSIFSEEIYKNVFLQNNKIPNLLIIHSIDFYNRYLNFLIKNCNNIYFIHFDQITKMYKDYISFKESDNKILKSISKKYNFKFTEDDGPRYNAVNYSSTVNKEVKSYLITNRYYIKKIKKSYKLYNRILELIKEDEELFSA